MQHQHVSPMQNSNSNDAAIIDICQKINMAKQTQDDKLEHAMMQLQSHKKPELWYEIRDPHGIIGLLRSRL